MLSSLLYLDPCHVLIQITILMQVASRRSTFSSYILQASTEELPIEAKFLAILIAVIKKSFWCFVLRSLNKSNRRSFWCPKPSTEELSCAMSIIIVIYVERDVSHGLNQTIWCYLYLFSLFLTFDLIWAYNKLNYNS